MPSPAENNVFLVTGDDEPVIRHESEKLARQLAGENPDPFALDIFREQDALATAELLRQLMHSLKSPSFLGGRKTVWLQHFNSFASEGTATGQTAEAKAFRELVEMIKQGLPGDIVLLMDGPGVDGKKALSKACKDKGQLVLCQKPNVRDRNWQAAMGELVAQRAAAKGAKLPREVCLFLAGAIGTDTAAIESEVEKLICFCGDQPITLAAAEEICTGQGEEVYWALTDALGERDAAEALRVVNTLLSQTNTDPEYASRNLLGQVASFYRQLLQILLFMARERIGAGSVKSALDQLTEEERNTLLADGFEVAGMNSWRAQNLAKGANRYQGQELVDAVCAVRDAYRRCITANVSVRILLEETILRLASRR